MEYYRKVFIKSEEDLPKEDGDYIVHSKSYGWTGIANWKAFENPNYPEYNQYLWLLNYDWYLLPVELPSVEEIIDYALDYVSHKSLKPANKGLIKDALIIGAKAMRDGKIQLKDK